jgi:hypothetical protein
VVTTTFICLVNNRASLSHTHTLLDVCWLSRVVLSSGTETRILLRFARISACSVRTRPLRHPNQLCDHPAMIAKIALTEKKIVALFSSPILSPNSTIKKKISRHIKISANAWNTKY